MSVYTFTESQGNHARYIQGELQSPYGDPLLVELNIYELPEQDNRMHILTSLMTHTSTPTTAEQVFGELRHAVDAWCKGHNITDTCADFLMEAHSRAENALAAVTETEQVNVVFDEPATSNAPYDTSFPEERARLRLVLPTLVELDGEFHELCTDNIGLASIDVIKGRKGMTLVRIMQRILSDGLADEYALNAAMMKGRDGRYVYSRVLGIAIRELWPEITAKLPSIKVGASKLQVYPLRFI